jgi:hypothetical protein
MLGLAAGTGNHTLFMMLRSLGGENDLLQLAFDVAASIVVEVGDNSFLYHFEASPAHGEFDVL